MHKVGLIFPGQGSQFVGMGKDLIQASAAARAIYTLADHTLGFPLSTIILEGPAEKLTPTDVAQPALLTATMAAWSALLERWQPRAEETIAAGHSLGEYSALVAAQVMDFSTALGLVRQRGLFMQTAAQAVGGGMAAVMGLASAKVEELCQQADAEQNVQVANFNCPGQVVISGSTAALEKIYGLARERKIRVIPLAVSGPFHSRFMRGAGEKLSHALQSITLQTPRFSVVANISAEPLMDPAAIRTALVEQVSGSVRWEASIRRMLQLGVTTWIEIGPGKVLRGLIKKIAPDIKVLNAFAPEDIEQVVATLAGVGTGSEMPGMKRP